MKPDFQISFAKALTSEGLISNNKSDHSGFTGIYPDFIGKGISQTKHPAWPGWKIIDATVTVGTASAVTSKLKNNDQLNQLVKEYYRSEFGHPSRFYRGWDRLQGDLLPSQLTNIHLNKEKLCAINCAE